MSEKRDLASLMSEMKKEPDKTLGKRDLKNVEKLTSMVFVSGIETNGKVVNSDNMMGKYVHNLESCDDDVLAFSNFGLFKVSQEEPISNIKFITAKSGKSFSIGLSTEGDVYTWGNGQTGELGLGLLYQQLEGPMKVQFKSPILEISCGSNHSIAIDEYGNAFGWGQNYDRQLGLYTKEQSEMKSRSCVVEDLVFSPRFLPFTLKLPMAKVSCGAKFTIFLSRSGQVWSCGAGECGQLGTGRCTNSAVPKQIPIDSQTPIVDISAGWAHVLATNTEGCAYSWGFNRFGQLGLGDNHTRHAPCKIETVALSRVFAHGNSSAGISTAGRLFTWGSNNNYRLMHCLDMNAHMSFPFPVKFLKDDLVQSFAFSKSGSAAMVLSRLTGLFPLSGPQKSFSKLEISGCGFWRSDDIIIKFTCIGGSGFAAPRSCPGTLKSPGVLVCKPPRLGEAGAYEITVAMDGSTFLPDKLYVNVFKDFSLISISPAIVDRRLFSSTQFLVMVKGITEIPKSNTIKAKVMIASSPECLAAEQEVEYIDVIGYFQEDEEEDGENPGENVSLDDQSVNKSANGVDVVELKKRIIFDVDFTAIKSVAPHDVAYMNVKFSLNDFDYCLPLPANKSVILHAFDPLSLVPGCYALDCDVELPTPSAKKEVSVCGTGFINTMGLRPGSTLEAILRAKVGKTFGEVTIPLRCHDSEVIHFVPPTVEQFVIASGAGLDRASYPTLLNTSVRFQLTCLPDSNPGHSRANTASNASILDQSNSQVSQGAPDSGVEIIQLSTKQLKLDLYTPQAVSIHPTVCRRAPGIPITITGKLKGGLKLRSSQAKLVFFNREANIEYVCDSELIRIIPVGDAVTDEIFQLPQGTDDSATPGQLTDRANTPYEPTDLAQSSIATASTIGSDTKKATGKVKGKKAKATDAHPVEIEIEYKVVVKLPEPNPEFDALYEALMGVDASNEETNNSASALKAVDSSLVPNWNLMKSVNVSLLLDGQTPVPDAYAAKMVFFDTLAIKPLPKGPFAPSSTLLLEVVGLVSTIWTEDGFPDDAVKCIVRFHAESTAATRSPCCDIVCQGSVSAQNITIILPEASQFTGLEPDPTSKAAKAKGPKNFFIGISIDDGNTFDYSEKAILPIK